MLKIFEVRNRTGWLQQQIILSAWRQVLWSVAHYWKSTGVDKSRIASLRGACQPLVHRWGLGLLEAVDKLARASPLRLWRKEPFFACAEEPNELEIKRKRMDKKALDRYQSRLPQSAAPTSTGTRTTSGGSSWPALVSNAPCPAYVCFKRGAFKISVR